MDVDGPGGAATARREEQRDPATTTTASLRSSVDCGRDGSISVDATLRVVGAMPSLEVTAYVEADLRLAWRPRPGLEVAAAGRNLVHERHLEYASDSLPFRTSQVGRRLDLALRLER